MLHGSYRTTDGKAQIDWTLEDGEFGPKFSAQGDYAGSGGQNLEDIARDYPNDETVQQIVNVWRKYHMNDTQPGTPAQMAAVDAYWAEQSKLHPEIPADAPHALAAKLGGDYYKLSCDALKAVGLYEVPITPDMHALGGFSDGATMYRYGVRWLYHEIPADVLAVIRSWSDLPPHAPLHEDRAKKFLNDHGLKFRAVQHADRCPPWCDGSCTHGDRYRVTISRKTGGRLSFDFWNSLDDVQHGKFQIEPYTVLANIALEAHAPDTFDAYCDEYGEDRDSRKALTTWSRLDKFASRLRGFFSLEEIEQLSEID